MPRAPRPTGREHHPFFDISYRPTAAREDPCFVCLLVSFSFVFAFSISPPLSFLFGTHAHSPNSALPRMLAPTAYHRCGRAPFGRFGILCTSRNLSLLFLLLSRSSSPCRTACNLLVQGSRGGGAESHTYSPHDARDMRIRALKFRQRTSVPLALFIHSACQLPKEWLRDMTTRCCCLFPKMK